MTTTAPSDTNRPHRGRRITWQEFFRLTGREPPMAENDNREGGGASHSGTPEAHTGGARTFSHPQNSEFGRGLSQSRGRLDRRTRIPATRN